MAMWVHPALRGSGAADALIASVCSWAAEEGAREIRLHVAEGNDRARHCYERNAFRPTGQHVTGARDGRVEIEMQRLVRGPASTF
jgi:ribosomal protein S18 acetylase RimI-like enzyme